MCKPGRTTNYRLGRALNGTGSHKAAESPNNVEEHEHSQCLQVSVLGLCKTFCKVCRLDFRRTAQTSDDLGNWKGAVHACITATCSHQATMLTVAKAKMASITPRHGKGQCRAARFHELEAWGYSFRANRCNNRRTTCSPVQALAFLLTNKPWNLRRGGQPGIGGPKRKLSKPHSSSKAPPTGHGGF